MHICFYSQGTKRPVSLTRVRGDKDSRLLAVCSKHHSHLCALSTTYSTQTNTVCKIVEQKAVCSKHHGKLRAVTTQRDQLKAVCSKNRSKHYSIHRSKRPV